MAGFLKLFKKKDRRKFNRFIVTEVTPVFFEPYVPVSANVIDISMGGLCFQYMTKENQNGDLEFFDIDIFISEDGYYLPSIPCKLVYEKKMKKAVSHPVSLEYRLCGLQFDKLSDEQTGQLISYMKNHTSGVI